MGALRGAWCGSLFIMLMAMMVTLSSGQGCTPDMITSGQVEPNADLPTQGVRLYFQEASEPIPDYLMLRASQVEARSLTPGMSPTLALWCQSANTDSNNGMWFQPPGSTAVSSMDIDSPNDEPYQMVTCNGQVGLVRDTGLGGTDRIGLVQCMIRDEMNITHTLTAGVYTGAIYDNYDGPDVDENMQFALISSRDADPPVFTLSFNSSNGPPTMVTCTRNGQALNTSLYTVSREVLQSQYVQNGDVDSVNASEPDMPDVTRVTVTVREREAGEYECTVTVMGRNDSDSTQVVTLGTPYSSTAMITVSGTPSNVVATRSSDTEVTVTWDVPTEGRPDGYEVFYQVDGGDILSAGNTASTTLTITGVTLQQEISCFVVTFGGTNTLPSARSNVAIVSPVLSVNIPSNSDSIAGTTQSITCSSTLPSSDFVWMRNGSLVNISDSRVTVISTSSSSTLTINPLRTSDGGQYQCMGNVSINGMTAIVTDEIDLNVTISIISVTVTIIPNDTLYEDTFSDFQCNATISEYVDTPTNIMYQWTLTAGSGFTINGDTLRINRFTSSDDGRTITCMATVLPLSAQQYVLQNTASESIQLTVEALNNAAFTPRITIPGAATAGDTFDIVCRLDGVIERLAVAPGTVSLSYSDSAPGGISGETLQTGPVRTRLRMFNPGMTDDVGMYTCVAVVILSSGGFFGGSSNGLLQIQIPPPQLTLTITSPSNITTLYEGTPVNLTCTATIDTTIVNTNITVSNMWIAPNREQLTSSSSNDRITIVDMLQSAPYTSVLIFDPADDMDTGDYQCSVTVVQNSSQPLILPSSNNATYNLNVTALPDPIVSVTTNGSTEAGQSFSLICTVTMASDQTPRPNVTWIKVTGGSTEFPMVTQETTPTTTTLTISFSPLTFSHRGQYRCMVTLNISTIYSFAGSEDYNIFVNFPPPTVVVEPPSVPVVAGTARDLTCTITLTNVDDINVMVNFTWGTPMGMLLSSSPRITISGTTQSGSQSTFTSTLSISPLSVVDTTMFACLVSVNSDPTDSFIIPTAANSSVDIAVEPLPPPTVMTTSSDTMSPGSSITLTCVVGVVDGLIVQPDIVWTKQAVSAGGDTALNTISVPPMRTNNTVTLTFYPTNTSDAGQYTCTATVDISAINVTVANNSIVNIRLRIPSPTVSLMLYSALGTVSANSSTTQTHLAGSTLTITCVIEIPLTVNTPFDVEMMWSKDDDDEFDTANVGDVNATAPRIDITTANETSLNRYETRLVFSTLSSSMDSGSYECSISIDSDDTLLYVEDSALVKESTTVNVQDPDISNFTVKPTMVAVLASACPDSEPHDSFTLVCRAMKPSVVIPELMVQWLHNGSMRAGDVSVSDNGTYVVNTLNVSNAQVSDAGLYQCMARIMIPDSPIVTTNDSSTVISRAMSVPNTPTAAVTAINPTNATIMITVPSIAYTNETYHILYTGQERDTDLAQSNTVSSDAEDIIATNSNYTITLSGLEEDTTYNYTVVATNCIGNTSTAVMSFRTLSTAPATSPMNCMSSTFFSTNTTLQWMAPPEIDQNGAITGYNLTCPNVTTSLSSTLGSPSTSITITDGIVAFMNYSCVLAAINVNGSSPTTNCSFETAQDIPGGAPNNFTVMVSMTSLWYRWTPPTIRNGIITNYIFSSVIENRTLAATARSYLLCGVNPGQSVTANIRASTVIGSGPQQTLMNTATARANTGVVNLEVVRTSATRLDVSWEEPRTPHGFINRYRVTVVNNDATTGTDTLTDVMSQTRSQNVTGLSASFSGLLPGVPYTITVTPLDRCDTTGAEVQTTNFTQELPAVRVPEYTPVRSPNGTVMVVSWMPLTLEEARGFIMYRVVLTSSTSKKRQDGALAMTVGPGASSVMFNMLDPNVPYSVSLGVVNNNDIPGGEVTPHPSNLFVATAVPPGPPIEIIAGVLVALILAVIAVVIVAIVLYVLWKRHQEKTGKAKFQDSLFQVDDTPAVRPLTTAEVTLEVTNGGDTMPLTEVRRKEDEAQDEVAEKETRMDEEMVIEHMKPIAKASFNEHVQQMHVNSDSGFESEYQSVAMHIQGITYAVSGLDCNKSKNRFANIFPYDHNRVELAVVDGVDGTDYVNASFVDGYSHVGAYIAAQGPLPTTIGDFWRMIWEYKITNIVMLTGVVEAGKKKCEQYWPEKVGETLDPNNGLMITMTSHVPFSDFIIRNLKLAKPADESAKALEITHFHFTAWPDHGVPQFATSLISFIGRVQKKHKKDAKIPLMVHCSAGVGRTGTFIMLDTMMDRLKNEDSINVYEFLHQMRKQRMHMVQTQLQYVFIHDALDELITCGETDIAASNLRARVNKMHKIVPGKNMTGFQDQFQLLEQVCYKPGEAAFTDSTQPFNLAKNRYPDKLPFNVSRPRLRPDGSSGSDYINGNFVDGYKQRNAYIATQGPLKNTVNDLWRMMWEFKSRAIVMLCNTIEEGEEKCYQYWPLQKDESTEFGKLKVTLQSEDVHEQYVIRKLHVCNEKGSKQDKDGVVVTQLHYTAWPEHGHPSAAVHIIEMMELLTRVQMKSGNKPITVICNDGVGRTGAFLCIHSQLERLKTDGEVDAFKYLKTARTRRQGLVAELDHYVFCHEVLADYVESFDPYANFKDV